MTSFIDVKNQTLLWNTIQKHPFTLQIFPPGSEQYKINWFKNNISIIYDKIINNEFSQLSLIDLNKESLKIMIDDLRQNITVTNSRLNSQSHISNNIQPSLFEQYSQLESDKSFSRESILQNKTTAFERDLINKQKEHDLFNTKPTPPTVKFDEVNDSVIKNMQELIEEQKRERERDLQVITGSYNTNPNPNTNTNIKPILNIERDNPNIQIDILEIQEEKQPFILSAALESKIEELTKKYTILMNFLEEKIPDFQNQFSQYDISNNNNNNNT